MVYPTIVEIFVLWILLSVVGGFFIGYRTVIVINVLITIVIAIGFMLEIGAYIFRLIFNL